MTLILTALCKDGICVCADTRYVDKKWTKGFKDGFDKIFKFKSCPLIIFNHGVNRFNNKYWDEYCLEYEQLGQWIGKDLIQIADNFKDFINDDVERELKKSKAESNVSGFVLCGKTPNNAKFKIKELYWSLAPEGVNFKPIRWKKNIIGSGNGYIKYLHDLMKTDEKMNKDRYWKSMNINRAKKELGKLFSIAVEKKKDSRGEEFSDEPPIIKSITD